MIRFAVPISNGRLSSHFGHCDKFALLDANPDARTIVHGEEIAAPEHQPGLLPRWLADRGVQVVIAGGMGSRAQALFEQQGIKVVVGAQPGCPEELVNAYLDGNLQVGSNVCDHSS
jgi:predicted Fe-Mo cluster-binding NifX family protein